MPTIATWFRLLFFLLAVLVAACVAEEPTAMAILTDAPFSTVSVGGGHAACGVKTDSSVFCWGSPHFDIGQLSPPSGSFASVTAGDLHTCGLKTDGSVICWGANNHGQSSPPSGSFSYVSAGFRHTCGAKVDSSVTCWGYNLAGQSWPSPSGSFSSVSAGFSHTCAVKSDGSVACWGGEEVVDVPRDLPTLVGNIRRGQSIPSYSGQSSPPSGTFSSVSAGSDHTCGVKANGSVTCWGDDRQSQSSPPSGAFSSVSAGSGHTCGVKSDGSVTCWGYNFTDQSWPKLSGSFSYVSAGSRHTCGLKTDGTVVCWGYNFEGERWLEVVEGGGTHRHRTTD